MKATTFIKLCFFALFSCSFLLGITATAWAGQVYPVQVPTQQLAIRPQEQRALLKQQELLLVELETKLQLLKAPSSELVKLLQTSRKDLTKALAELNSSRADLTSAKISLNNALTLIEKLKLELQLAQQQILNEQKKAKSKARLSKLQGVFWGVLIGAGVGVGLAEAKKKAY